MLLVEEMHRRRRRGVGAQQQFEIARSGSILRPHALTPCLALVLSHSLQSDRTLTEHTLANTYAYNRIPGLDESPHVTVPSSSTTAAPIFAIVPFAGVLIVAGETGRMYFRVQAHLLRYTLLDVDGTLPPPLRRQRQLFEHDIFGCFIIEHDISAFRLKGVSRRRSLQVEGGLAGGHGPTE
jgi:hypothetical protein